jgi:hypothetical protein
MSRFLAIAAAVLLWTSVAFGVDPSLATANGAVVKANAELLLVRPRGADGKFEKALSLKIRGTTKVTVLSFQQRGGQTVPIQREAEVKDLQPEQVVSVIYTNVGDAFVLLSAVALPHKDK